MTPVLLNLRGVVSLLDNWWQGVSGHVATVFMILFRVPFSHQILFLGEGSRLGLGRDGLLFISSLSWI